MLVNIYIEVVLLLVCSAWWIIYMGECCSLLCVLCECWMPIIVCTMWMLNACCVY